MPGSTAKGFPYPLPTEPVAQGAAAIQALAEAADARAHGHEWAYTERITNVSITGTSEAAATVIIPGVAATYDGAPVIAHFSAATLIAGGTSNVYVLLWEGAASLGRIGVQFGPAGSSFLPFQAFHRFTPSAGVHTYQIRAYIDGAAPGAVNADVGGPGKYLPSFLRLTKA